MDGTSGEGNVMLRLVVLGTGLAAVGLIASMGANAATTDQASPSFRQMLRAAPDTVERDRDGEHRLVFAERNAVEVDIDNAPAEFSQGDEVAITSVLTKHGKHVGRFDGHAVFTLVDEDAEMVRALLDATASLPKGEIEVQGVVTFRVDTAEFDVAVVGGTGRYDDVGGEAHIVEDGETVRYVFDLEKLD
jgi:hypothetical protein